MTNLKHETKDFGIKNLGEMTTGKIDRKPPLYDPRMKNVSGKTNKKKRKATPSQPLNSNLSSNTSVEIRSPPPKRRFTDNNSKNIDNRNIKKG